MRAALKLGLTAAILGTLLGGVVASETASAEHYPKFLTLPFATADFHIDAGWFYNDGSPHRAINYSRLPEGTQILAAADGLAMSSCQPLPPEQNPTSPCGRNFGSPFNDTFGNFVLIDHGNGISTLYAHMDEVAEGIHTCPPEDRRTCPPTTMVTRGQPIGVVGKSGTTFIHLHFEAADNSAGTYLGHVSNQNRIDPYDIYNKAAFYPPEARFEGSGSHHLWTSDPPAPPSNVSPPVGPAPAGGDGAVGAGHTANITVQRGTIFDVTFNFTNTGKTTWRENQQYKLGRLGWDADMGAPLRLLLEPGETVSPGETKQWTVQMTAPAPGVYHQTWQMVRENLHWFGDQATVEVTVVPSPCVLQHSGGPGMSLFALNTVSVGQTFMVTICSDPAPNVELWGFASEVVFPDELSWLQRPMCTDEVVVERQDGGPLALCVSFISEILHGAFHSVLTEIAPPPVLEPLNVAPGSVTPLVELDFMCTTAGTHTLTLTAVPDSGFGALYGDVNGNVIEVRTEPFDYDGDTVPNQVADFITIECVP